MHGYSAHAAAAASSDTLQLPQPTKNVGVTINSYAAAITINDADFSMLVATTANQLLPW